MPSQEFARFQERLLKAFESMDGTRGSYDAAMAALLPASQVVRFTRSLLNGIPAEMAVSGDGGNKLIYYIHGGGFSMGSAFSSRRFTGALAEKTGQTVWAPDYRLAPEHPYPAAVLDCLDAYCGLLQIAPASDIALIGDSAGGNLCLATMLLARDMGLPLPASITAISPVADFRAVSGSYQENSGEDRLISREGVLAMAEQYLGQLPRECAYASPALGSYKGFPPMLVLVGGSEVLQGDAEAVAKKARQCGVPVDLQVWPDMMHVFPVFAGEFPEADQGLDAIVRFMQSVWE